MNVILGAGWDFTLLRHLLLTEFTSRNDGGRVRGSADIFNCGINTYLPLYLHIGWVDGVPQAQRHRHHGGGSNRVTTRHSIIVLSIR